jgi:peptidoglycan/LPS O-acetylase OafA/YrhL
MTLKLIEIKDLRNNNLNLLRFLAALLVLFGHSYALSKSNISHEWLLLGLTLFIYTTFMTLLSSILSWHYIEKPILTLKKSPVK